jgi:hypothetical protein
VICSTTLSEGRLKKHHGVSRANLDSARSAVVGTVDIRVATVRPQPASRRPLPIPPGIVVVVGDASIGIDVLAVDPGPEIDTGRSRSASRPTIIVSVTPTYQMCAAGGVSGSGALNSNDKRSCERCDDQIFANNRRRNMGFPVSLRSCSRISYKSASRCLSWSSLKDLIPAKIYDSRTASHAS